ncbi:MAG: sigma-70 family RNA polymerase sigma factor [Clostridia bacterium]|nr:sigma-70 family RNA polymerase sigma factor [Clostridia bacterium]
MAGNAPPQAPPDHVPKFFLFFLSDFRMRLRLMEQKGLLQAEEPMEDSKIIDLFFARDERAIAETDLKYGRYCFTVANAILGDPENSEEVVNDTLLNTWNAIPPKRPTVFKMFLAKIARNLAFTRRRSATAKKRGGTETEAVLEELEECIAAPGRVEDSLDLKALTATIRAFLDTQSPREQNIFLRRYFFVESTDSIAARYSMRPDAVRKSLSRTREKLKKHLVREGYTV